MRSAVRFGVVVGALAGVLQFAAVAHADPRTCRAAIIKETARLARVEADALRECRRRALAGKPSTSDCRGEPKVTAAVGRAASKLRSGIARKCGGSDRRCGAGDGGDETLASIGWNVGVCPDVERAGCTNPIGDCNDVAACLVCTADAAAAYAARVDSTALVVPTPTDRVLARCRKAIAIETANLFTARTTILEQCWAAVNKSGTSARCPGGDPTGRAPTALARAEARARAKICNACGGRDRVCGGPDDLEPAVIGFPRECSEVTVPDGDRCGSAVSTLGDVVACLACVTSFRATCLGAISVPWATSYPAQCNPGCGNGLREEAEDCDGADATACPGRCQSDCRCTDETRTTTSTTVTTTSRPTSTSSSTTTAPSTTTSSWPSTTSSSTTTSITVSTTTLQPTTTTTAPSTTTTSRPSTTSSSTTTSTMASTTTVRPTTTTTALNTTTTSRPSTTSSSTTTSMTASTTTLQPTTTTTAPSTTTTSRPSTTTTTSRPAATSTSSTTTTSRPASTTTTTSAPQCGNGIIEGTEQCDDVGCAADQVCLDNCTCAPIPVCGNGILEVGEECDGAGCAPGQACVDCTCQVTSSCGNGVLDPGEQCDGSGCRDGEECLADCTCSVSPLCGNGLLDPGEDCDGGRCPNGQECPEDCRCP